MMEKSMTPDGLGSTDVGTVVLVRYDGMPSGNMPASRKPRSRDPREAANLLGAISMNEMNTPPIPSSLASAILDLE